MELKRVIRRLSNGEEFEAKCFFDNGWYTSDGVRINDVVEVLDKNKE